MSSITDWVLSREISENGNFNEEVFFNDYVDNSKKEIFGTIEKTIQLGSETVMFCEVHFVYNVDTKEATIDEQSEIVCDYVFDLKINDGDDYNSSQYTKKMSEEYLLSEFESEIKSLNDVDFYFENPNRNTFSTLLVA